MTTFRAPKAVRCPFRLAILLCEEAIAYDDDRKAWVCPECGGEGKLRMAIEHELGCDLKLFYRHVRSIDDKLKARRAQQLAVGADAQTPDDELLPENWVWDRESRATCRAYRTESRNPAHVEMSRHGKLRCAGNVPVRVFSAVRARAARLGFGPKPPRDRHAGDEAI